MTPKPTTSTYLKSARQVKATTSITRYHDVKFEKKEKTYPVGTIFDIEKVVTYGKITRLLLGNGLYITSNVKYVEKLK
ncbi:hypothetical protein DIS15_10490 [Levilactobacillus brevis]|nr:hypothetical protein DIS15_10490 [Levilactobacillus brevis]